jgi:Fur family zinc uptake transcriptional regulator
MTKSRSATDDAVLLVLKSSMTPLTAYQLLDALRPSGVQSPPIVYRALDRLARAGAVHRLEQSNAYFACHGHHDNHDVIFAVCRVCKRVEEWPGGKVDMAIAQEAVAASFAMEARTIEVSGLCAACAAAQPARMGSACGHDHG